MIPFEYIEKELSDHSPYMCTPDDSPELRGLITGLRRWMSTFETQREADIAFISTTFSGVFNTLHYEFAIDNEVPTAPTAAIAVAVYRALLRLEQVDILTDGLPIHVQEWLAVRNIGI